MKKHRKQKSPRRLKMTAHSSLNPEFDAVNEAALEEVGSQMPNLICDQCRTEYVFDTKFIGTYCNDSDTYAVCDGKLRTQGMIKLPDSVKTGKKSYGTQQWNGGHDQGYGSYNNVTYVSCKHPGDKVVFEFHGKKLYASNSSSLEEKSNKWELIVDLAGVARIPKPAAFIGEGPGKYRELKEHIVTDIGKYPDLLRLNWSDMGAPPVKLAFWTRLWDLLPEKTVICCFGGHGRTGTCIASLMIAAGVDYYSAVKTVRAEHCDKAIESISQELYLHNIYLDMLKLDLVAAPDDTVRADIAGEIKFAMEHRPTSKSSYGEIEVEKVQPPFVVQPGTGGMGGSVNVVQDELNGEFEVDDTETDFEWEDEDTKIHNGHLFVKQCVNKQCVEPNCKVAQHQGWIEWDLNDEKVVG